MLEAVSTPRNRTLTFVFLAICCASATAAVVAGIDDNSPGILLAWGAATALVLAFVHPWRTERQFGLFLGESALGLLNFGILHNVFEGVASKAASGGALQSLLQGLSVATFFLAVLICLPAILVGAVGWAVMSNRNRRRGEAEDEKGLYQLWVCPNCGQKNPHWQKTCKCGSHSIK